MDGHVTIDLDVGKVKLFRVATLSLIILYYCISNFNLEMFLLFRK